MVRSQAAVKLKRLRERAGMSVRELADAIGRPASTYASYEDKYKKPYLPIDLVRALIPVLGKHGVEKGDLLALAGVSAAERRASSDEDSAEIVPAAGLRVQELDVSASAGPGLEVNGYHVVGEWEFPLEFLRHATDATPDQLKVIRVKGDSMKPVLNPNDKVIVDTSDKTPTPSGMFVVWDGLGQVIKWVEHIAHSDPPTVRIKSEKSGISPYERTLEEAYIQGRVLGKWEWT